MQGIILGIWRFGGNLPSGSYIRDLGFCKGMGEGSQSSLGFQDGCCGCSIMFGVKLLVFDRLPHRFVAGLRPLNSNP